MSAFRHPCPYILANITAFWFLDAIHSNSGEVFIGKGKCKLIPRWDTTTCQSCQSEQENSRIPSALNAEEQQEFICNYRWQWKIAHTIADCLVATLSQKTCSCHRVGQSHSLVPSLWSWNLVATASFAIILAWRRSSHLPAGETVHPGNPHKGLLSPQKNENTQRKLECTELRQVRPCEMATFSVIPTTATLKRQNHDSIEPWLPEVMGKEVWTVSRGLAIIHIKGCKTHDTRDKINHTLGVMMVLCWCRFVDGTQGPTYMRDVDVRACACVGAKWATEEISTSYSVLLWIGNFFAVSDFF